MKKTKRMLISALLVFTLCMLTACGNNNNAADEVPNTANDGIDNVGDGAAEDNLTDDADNNGNDDGNNGTDGNMAGDTAVPDDANTANDGTAVPGNNVTENNNSVSGAIGEGVEDLGDGVADGVRDIGEGVGNAVEDVLHIGFPHGIHIASGHQRKL